MQQIPAHILSAIFLHENHDEYKIPQNENKAKSWPPCRDRERETSKVLRNKYELPAFVPERSVTIEKLCYLDRRPTSGVFACYRARKK